MTEPRRVYRAAVARARFGALADRIWTQLLVADPVADRVVADFVGVDREDRQRLVEAGLRGCYEDAPASLRELIEPLRADPAWLDWSRIRAGGRLLRRSGPLGGVVLAVGSLVHGYAAPAGNKPLVMTGRLEHATVQRLTSTGRFVAAVCQPDGLRPGGAGFCSAIKVRLMHAQVRRLLGDDPRWSTEAWGVPINQHDMLSTVLLFSTAFSEGLSRLGLRVSPRERDDYVHVWRRVGELMGVDPRLLPQDDAQAWRLAELIGSTQAPPDDDARRLTRTLLDTAGMAHPSSRWRAAAHVGWAEAVCRRLVGDQLADALAVPRRVWSWTLPPLIVGAHGFDWVRERVAAVDSWTERAGTRHWHRVVEPGPRGLAAAFGWPDSLATTA